MSVYIRGGYVIMWRNRYVKYLEVDGRVTTQFVWVSKASDATPFSTSKTAELCRPYVDNRAVGAVVLLRPLISRG